MLQKKHLFVLVIIVLEIYSIDCNYVKCDITKASSEKSNECPENAKCVEGILDADNSAASNTSGSSVSFSGLCACRENYVFNKKIFSKTDSTTQYCIKSEIPQPTPTNSPPTLQSSTASPSTAKPIVSSTTTTKSILTTIKTTLATTKASSITTKKPEPLKSTTTLAPQVTTKKVELTTTKPSNESPHNNDKQPEQQKQEKVETPSHHILGGILLPVMIVLAFIGAVYGIRKYDLLERVQSYIRNRRNGGQPHQTRYDGFENDFEDDPILI